MLCNLGDVVYMVNMVSLVILVTLVEHYLRSPCNAILGVCATVVDSGLAS